MGALAWPGPSAELRRRIHQAAAEDYADLLDDFMKGRLDEAAFRLRRGYYGVHGRPSPGQVMLRLKTDLGRLDAAQLRAAAALARRFTPAEAFHISTRQNLQFYDVALEDSPAFLRDAVKAGFGVAGAGGRNPRSVTLPAGAGLGPGEAFDPSWAAALLQIRFEADEALRELPGKVKVGFWRSLHDDEAEPGNDITVIPVRRLVGSRLRRGFRLLLGGGLGSTPRVETLWKSFVAPEDLYAHLRAVLLHFKEAGDRRKPQNRLRHLVRGEGWPAFAAAVEEQLEEQPRDRAAAFHHRLPLPREPYAPRRFKGLRSEVRAQAGRDRFRIRAQAPGGNLSAGQAEALAALAETQGDGALRLNLRQQLWLTGLPEGSLKAADQALASLGLARGYRGAFSACPGSLLCENAGVDTMEVCGLALDALEAAGPVDGDDPTQGFKLGVSGCETGCGHHRNADLGLEGLRRGQPGRPQSFVRVYGRSPAVAPSLAQALGVLPLARLPQLLERWLADFRHSGQPDLASYLRQKEGWTSLERHLEALAGPPLEDPGAGDAQAGPPTS